jgi:anti-sigma factor RsiW
MHNCDKVKPLISGYIDGDIFPENKKLVEDHLSICPKCREAIRRVKEICRSLSNLPYLTTSKNFESELHQRIANLNGSGSLRLPFPLQNWRGPVFGFAAIAVVALFLWVFNSGNESGNTPTNNISIQGVVPPQPQPAAIPGGSGVSSAASQQSGSAADSLKEGHDNDLDKSGVQLVREKE